MKKLWFVVALFYSLCVFNVALGDDTEIYTLKNGEVGGKPNLLFVIDTSGSMGWDLNGRNDTSDESRMSIVKRVMKKVIDSLSDVNVGLMRFNVSNGGPVILPVKDIDSLESGSRIFSQEISDNHLDGEEDSAGNVSLNSELLSLENEVGLQFNKVVVPRGSTINAAHLTLTSSMVATSALDVYGELSAESQVLKEINGNISARKNDRNKVTGDSKLYEQGKTYTFNIQSLVERITGQNTNGGNWCGGSDITLIVKARSGSGFASFYSVEGASKKNKEHKSEPVYIQAPGIYIDYTPPVNSETACIAGEASGTVKEGDVITQTPGDNGHFEYSELEKLTSNSKTAMTFTGNLALSKGARIEKAELTLRGAEEFELSRVTGTIRGIIDFSSDFTRAEDKADNDSHRLALQSLITRLSTESVELNTPTVNRVIYEDGEKDGVILKYDVSTIVNEIINKPEWNALINKLSFVLDIRQGCDDDACKLDDYDYAGQEIISKINIEHVSSYEEGMLTYRDKFKLMVDNLNAVGSTPISDVMSEAGRYFRGEALNYGKTRHGRSVNSVSAEPTVAQPKPLLPLPNNCTMANYHAESCASEQWNDSPVPEYDTPIDSDCQQSYIVFLSDGEPNSHHESTIQTYNGWLKIPEIEETIEDANKVCTIDEYSILPNGNKHYGNGSNCARSIAAYLHAYDHKSDNDVKKVESVSTHTIAFGNNGINLLKDMARAGGGGYVHATNEEKLFAAFGNIITAVMANVTASFVSTGVSINLYNRLTHHEALYFSLFAPQPQGKIWPGNIKRYKLLNGEIVDQNNINAINGTSQFNAYSKSWWSKNRDGNEVAKGGVAEQLGESRVVYSNLTTTNILNNVGNVISDNNASITNEILGTDATNNDRSKIINWIKGKNEKNQKHHIIGDPLHSQPTIVTYKTGFNASTKKDITKSLVFVGTNHGFLHAFDTESGGEQWAFIPKQQLKRIRNIMLNQLPLNGGNVSDEDRYGLDGEITIYHEDLNDNGMIDRSSGKEEKAYLYIGMRRGGNAYYAIDISQPGSPELMFKIDPAVSGFNQIGQSWSKPVIGKINIKGEENKLVMIFGGGYDNKQDRGRQVSQKDDVGNRVYIADALDGSHIWDSHQLLDATTSKHNSLEEMNSVPATVTAFDIDNDAKKLIDHIYASDTKGQIFRFDINNQDKLKNNVSFSNISGGRIAHLQDGEEIVGEPQSNNRRFYYAPDASMVRLPGELPYVSVAIGSGYRAHPKEIDVVQNYFYMIKDKSVLSEDKDARIFKDVDMSNLVDVTNLFGVDATSAIAGTSTTAGTGAQTTAGKDGWYIKLDKAKGEKVIQRSTTFNHVIMFTSYMPAESEEGENQCSTGRAQNIGRSRFYGVSVTNGSPIRSNLTDPVSATDRYTLLNAGGIAPPPQVLLEDVNGRAKKRLCVGAQCGGALEEFLPGTIEGVMGLRWKSGVKDKKEVKATIK